MKHFLIALFALSAPCSLASAEPSRWQSLLKDIDTTQSVAGQWKVEGDTLSVSAANGARLPILKAPQGEYDFRVSFTRKTGHDSIALIFVHGGRPATFEVDAWGQHLTGIQSIAGADIRQNPTRNSNGTLQNGQKYKMTVEVRKDHVRCLLNDKEVAKHHTDGSDLSLPDLWRLPNQTYLGLGAWNSATLFHSVEVRSISGEAPQVTQKKPRDKPAPELAMKRPQPSPATTGNSSKGKHVLIVIANQDFFYREYADPRAELERAGIRVTVAAGVKAPCRPHHNSGQGQRSGVVQPDLALSQVKVSDYDAVLFSGGWGSSSYQYAFRGRYNTGSYNGNQAIKAQANRIINEFIQADKYTCALCNAVSVLAWARLDGKSPLAGKRVCAPTRAAPTGIYNGKRGQPSCRWHPEQNGATMSPAGSIGRPGTAVDDVCVDGKIVTGEDDISAREMGRTIARLLSKQE